VGVLTDRAVPRIQQGRNELQISKIKTTEEMCYNPEDRGGRDVCVTERIVYEVKFCSRGFDVASGTQEMVQFQMTETVAEELLKHLKGWLER